MKQRHTTPRPEALREGLTKMPSAKMEFTTQLMKVKIKPKTNNNPTTFSRTLPNCYGGSCSAYTLAYIHIQRQLGPIPFSRINLMVRNLPTPLNMLNFKQRQRYPLLQPPPLPLKPWLSRSEVEITIFI